MVPGGTISGKILNSNGKPVVDARVQALRLAYQSNGLLTPQVAMEKMADDRGEFRIYRLPPGDYFIVTIPQRPGPAGAVNQTGPAREVALSTFYPNVEDLATAMPVALRSGEELSGIDIRVRSVAGATISGKVINNLPGPAVRSRTTSVGPAGEIRPAIAEVSLVSRNRKLSDESFGIVTAAADGSFQIQNVLPGSYDLIAQLPVTAGWGQLLPPPFAPGSFAFGRTAIEVRGSTDDVSVTVHPGTDLRGTILLDGKPTAAAVRVILQPDDVATTNGILGPILGQVNAFEPAIGPDGSFLIPVVPEAHYRVQVSLAVPQVITDVNGQNAVRTPQQGLVTLPANAYLADVQQGGTSVFDDGINVGRASGSPIEIHMKTDPGSVEGVITGTDGRPVAERNAVLVPDTNRRKNTSLYKVVRSDTQGRFTFAMVPPGSYKVFSWDSVQAGAYLNAAFLERFEQRGQVVTVLPQSRTTANVTLIPVK
jgi:hypothetical protein